MATNRVQEHVCDILIEQITRWRDSEDINDPQHMAHLDSALDDLVDVEGWISEDEAWRIERPLIMLHAAISNIKED